MRGCPSWRAVGVLTLVVAGVVGSTSSAGAGPSEAWLASGELSASDPAVGGLRYDAYRLRVTSPTNERPEDITGYLISAVTYTSPVTLCTTTAPFHSAMPFAGTCRQSTEVEGTSGLYAMDPRPLRLGEEECVTVVVAAAAGTEYTVGVSGEPVGADWTVTPLGLTEACDRSPTELVADPALVDVQPGRVKAPLGVVAARLTSRGLPLAGKVVAFSGINGRPICVTETAADGVARCSNLGAVLLGGHAYRASFAGDGAHAPSEARGTLVRLHSISLF